jgi:hypothetical protein
MRTEDPPRLETELGPTSLRKANPTSNRSRNSAPQPSFIRPRIGRYGKLYRKPIVGQVSLWAGELFGCHDGIL